MPVAELALDRDELIARVDALESAARGLYIGVAPDGHEVLIGQDHLLVELNRFAIDVRTLDIEGSD